MIVMLLVTFLGDVPVQLTTDTMNNIVSNPAKNFPIMILLYVVCHVEVAGLGNQLNCSV